MAVIASRTPADRGARGAPTAAASPPAAPAGGARLVLLISLALMSTISPFGTDMYLPSFPRIAEDLSTTPSGVQLTLTTFLVGVALGQLVFGPLSDRLGRKPPLVIGTVVCVAASVVAVLAPSIEVLLVARFFQSVGGAAGIVIARAIVADVFRGPEAASIFSVLAVLGGLAPIVAPIAGGLLAIPIGWRGVLAVLAGLAGAMCAVAVFVIRETAPRVRPDAHAATGSRKTAPHLGSVLCRPGFTAYALVKTCSFAALMGYISASPFLFQDLLGLNALQGAGLFALNSLTMIIASAVNARLVRRRGPALMLRVGLILLTVAAITLALAVVFAAPPWAAVPTCTLLVGCMGFVFGNSIALAIGHAHDAAGAGSAWIGFSQFVVGAAVAPIVGLGGGASLVPLAVVVVAATAVAWGCATVGGRADRLGASNAPVGVARFAAPR
ncbi:multidrug effflux MFS transporter [Knoellia sp. S7-12]|uniref:multidrug effflux MFS transporter n=1 Tax=Knoellia sp. S7-12 TaxID=3126698 RepID=UPI0033685DFD